ncbi:hypothetical protein GF362_02820 [Candidatus Dojkabacteria bacterium]|nr:hypothetical protein [Candidatus Dojkabacteria bacterium]
MNTILGITTLLVVSTLFSLIISFPIIDILYKFKITRRGEVDFANLIEDRKKKIGTPIMGGLIVIISVIVINLVFNRDPNGTISGSIKVPLLIFGISAILGALDDVLNIYGKPRKIKKVHRILKLIKVHKSYLMRIWYALCLPWYFYKRLFFIIGSNPGKGIHAHEKILVQSIIGFILSYWICFKTGWSNAESIWLPFWGWFDLGFLMIPFIIFAIISMSNAVNLSDGMDGLAAGLLLSSFAGFFVISLYQKDYHIAILIITTIGSLLTYLYFNAPPARFQMGDVGSLALGTLLATIAFALRVPLLLPIIGLPFVAEVGSSLIQAVSRRFLGRRIFEMAPLHHHFEMKGWNEEKVVIRFWLTGLVCSIFGVWLYFLLF